MQKGEMNRERFPVKTRACQRCGNAIEHVPGRGRTVYCGQCKAIKRKESRHRASERAIARTCKETNERHESMHSKMIHAFGKCTFSARNLAAIIGKDTPVGLGPVLVKMERDGVIERVGKHKYRMKTT